MPDLPSPSQNLWNTLQERVIPILVAVYQAFALGIFVLIPILAYTWIRVPFMGAFTEHTLIIPDTGHKDSPYWELYSKTGGGPQLVTVDGQEVRTARQLINVLKRHQVGDVLSVTVRDNNNAVSEYTTRLIHFPLSQQIEFLYVPYVLGLAYLICGLWVFSLRRKQTSGQAFAVFTTSVAFCTALIFDNYTTQLLVPLWSASLVLAAASMFSLALVFPNEGPFIKRYPYVRWLGYILAVISLVYTLTTLYQYGRPRDYFISWRVEYAMLGIMGLFFLVWTGLRYFLTKSPIAKEQARLILWGSAVSFVVPILWFILTISAPQTVLFSTLILLPLGLFPVVVAYTILRYRLLNTDYLIGRALLYGILTVLAVGGYAGLVAGLALISKELFATENVVLIGSLSFILAIALLPLRVWLQKLVDRIFARGQAAYRERLQSFGRELTRAMELPMILGILRQYVETNIVPSQTHIYIHDPLTEHYIATPSGNGSGSNRPTSDLRFSANSPLVYTLASRRASLYLGEATSVPAALVSEQTRLALLSAQLFVPLPGRQKLAGWLALGPRRSGEPYTARDLEFLESLCDQAALAVERAQVVGDLERRVHAMNVLTRVSQGINVTLNFDDILELIFAQTSQVIPSKDFRITLKDTYSDILYHVFYLDNDDRFTERENRPLPIGQGLEQELVRNRRPIVTDDYERECRSRGALPSYQGIYAWAGVPLNTGAETIGAISLGSREPTIIFTDEQVNLLQAIADQAAGAIVKARLLQEAERRTRQLTTLNEVARSLTSTLDLNLLLNQILNSAVDILNCEAGSLLLVDTQTDELVFQVVVGPPESANLLGQRMPPGTGLVGKAVETREAIIANDVRRTKEWFEKPDEQTGFMTKDLLVVPMQVKDQVTGVIEVINRKDGLPFTPDDQGLLAAFTSQAAVALDNARLYTQTDQSLAARVEELSVMQRIDRELNASLDVSRAMRITLEWAMRQSGADAGLVGMIEKDNLRVMAYQGYTNELAAFTEGLMPIIVPAIHKAIESGQPQCAIMEDSANKKFTLLAKGQGQIIIPIRREAQVVGIILLESLAGEACPEDTLAFLSRLSDHAAIAITNARLFGEVKEANLAKSKFVSFVAHELKNPMASIKGYTELVAGGMAGPINEMQTSFLATVRSNVDRMNTIVSDLNDLTKIEVGGMRLDFKAVQAREIIEEVIRSFNRQIEDKEQKLHLDVLDSLPKVWADQMRISQILTNLLSNAHKYTPQGGDIYIGANVSTTEPGITGSLEVVHLWVKDTGIGISPEDQKLIFSQYFRTDASKEMASGTGLGLTITKSLIEMQGGRIWFESEVGKGTTFHFTIPIVEAT